MGRPNQLTLTWNNHSALIKESLHNLHEKESYCDATLVCQGKYFPAHKFILSMYSSYFEEVLEMTPCRHPFIIIKDILEYELKALLEFMYKGAVNVYEDNISSLLKVAETFKIKGLTFPEDYSATKYESESEGHGSDSLCSPIAKRKKTKTSGMKRKSSTVAKGKMKKRSMSEKNACNKIKDASILESPARPSTDQENEVLQDDPQPEENLPEFPNASPNSISFPQIIVEDESDTFMCPEHDIKIENDVMEEENYCEDSFNALDPSNNAMSHYPVPVMDYPVPVMEKEFVNQLEDEKALFAHLLEHDGEPGAGGEESDHSFDESQNEVSDPDWNQKGKKFFRCPICNYQPKSRSDLQDHRKIHTDEKPFKCTMCPYSTAHNYNLKVHFRIHTGEKPFKCNICSYSTIQRSNLGKHVRIHTGERPFKCPYCSYSGAQKSSLNKHMESHTEVCEEILHSNM